MKKILIFAIFISFFSFYSQNVDAYAPAYDYICDSRPNSVLSTCGECDYNPCDFTQSISSACSYLACPSGTVFVDCYGTISKLFNCIALRCGNAGVVSGNTCVQNSAYDSSCVGVASKTYGWADNTDLLSCTCNPTVTAYIDQFGLKADGTACTKNGNPAECKSGICIVPTCTPCIDTTPCEPPTCSAATPGNRCVRNPITNMGELKADPTCVGCAATLTLNPGAGGGSCPISATVAATGCDGKAFEVKEGATVKCSGTISGTSGSCSFLPSDSVLHNYDLYVGGASKDTGKSAKCGGGNACEKS